PTRPAPTGRSSPEAPTTSGKAAPAPSAAAAPPTAPRAEVFSGKIKERAGPLDAEVIRSGKPNQVRIRLPEGKHVDVKLNGYAPLPVGTVVEVTLGTVTKKKDILDASFQRMKR
ncbi:MAG: hypothetical protein WBA12_09405, partial [Catalinimonas sp.]